MKNEKILTKNFADLGYTLKEAGVDLSGNLPNIGMIPDIVVDAVSAQKASAEAQKRRAYAEEMGRKKAHSENAVKKYSELKYSGGILAPEDQQKFQSAQSSVKMIDEFMRGLDKELKNHVELSYLIERIRIAQSEPTALEMETCLTRAVVLERMRVQEKTKGAKTGKYPRNVLFWNGRVYLSVLETPANFALVAELRKLSKAVSQLNKAHESQAKKAYEEKVVMQMRERADSVLWEMIAGEKEGIAYVYLPPVKFPDGKQLDAGHLLLRLVKKEQGAKIICLEAQGRLARKYEELRKRKRFLPIIYIRVGKITGYFKDKQLFDDMRVFLRDIFRGLEYEKSHEAVADTLIAVMLGSLP